MANIYELKEQVAGSTPLLLVDCELGNGSREHWSTHRVRCGEADYEPRIVRHNAFEMEIASDQGVDGIPRLSITLANADSHFSEIERAVGFKGAHISARIVFAGEAGTPAAEGSMLFRGIANPPEDITEQELRLTAVSRMGIRRALVPGVRIQRRCPWEFPRDPEQRDEGLYGGTRGRYSRFFRCGYSADVEGGAGNLNGGEPFTSCGYTRRDCELRGMFSTDASGAPTRRFAGFEFVPASIQVRSYGEAGTHAAAVAGNEAHYNDVVPLVYGTAWYDPPITCARNDGNLTHMEVLLGMGEMSSVLKVLVNGIEIPRGQAGTNMTATGWYNVVSWGNRTGVFNLDFTGGEPHGSMAYLSVVVPNRINDGRSLPRVTVLAEGLRLPVYGSDGAYLEDRFTANPAWILLDILQRSGWTPEEIDMASFAAAAACCDEPIDIQDVHGNTRPIARFQCNLAVQKRRSAADLIRGVRNAGRLFLTSGPEGTLQVRVEDTIARQQPYRTAWSNASQPLNGGWPSYEFGDGTNGTTGIARKANGEAGIRVWSRSMADTPNRFTVEFQDAFNEYQQDSFSIVDVEDTARTGQEVTAAFAALGIANSDQAARILKCSLDKAVYGNTYVEFETSVKGLGLRPGDVIALTYLKEGFERQSFRVIRVAPGMNYRRVKVTAQIHRDEWYADTNGVAAAGGRREPVAGMGIPRPLSGDTVDGSGVVQFSVAETAKEGTDGSTAIELTVGFTNPGAPAKNGPGIPLVSLAAEIGTGGSIGGDQTLYYAVSAIDEAGVESGLSFTIAAAIPPGEPVRSVTITGLSFAPGAAGFHVYRGANPSQMRRIAASCPIAAQFTDRGSPDGTAPPPDPNYDHANFYWRLETVPECPATLYSSMTVGSEALEMPENRYRGLTVRIVSGTGAGQERSIAANTSATLTLSSEWTIIPDATSRFAIAESGWRFGSMAKEAPATFEVPNRMGAVVQISGRAANALDLESPAELCTLTRWRIGGGSQGDSEAPPAPLYAVGLGPAGYGSLELSGVSFPEYTNTRTITAGTLNLYYWDELQGLPQHALAAALTAADEIITLNQSGPAVPGDYIQVRKEVLRVEDVMTGGLQYRVGRGAHTSTAAEHEAGSAVYHLRRKIVVVPFVKDFFGAPVSGDWSYPVVLPNVRVASAEFSVTNARGTSEFSVGCLTRNTDGGLRTLSGGQFCIQVDGFLAIDSAPAPELIVEAAASVRDIFAVLRDAADADVRLTITQDGSEYCRLTIPAGATISDVADGLTLPPLQAGARIGLEVLAVGSTVPGSDLTVIIRL